MKAIDNRVIGRIIIYVGTILMVLSIAAGESVVWGVMGITYNGMDYWTAVGAIYAANWIRITLTSIVMITVCEVAYRLLSKKS